MNIAVIEPPTNQDWCHRTLFFADPEANIIEIFADIHPRDTAALPSKLHQIASL
jgi:catechol-2,3-dioxygenase